MAGVRRHPHPLRSRVRVEDPPHHFLRHPVVRTVGDGEQRARESAPRPPPRPPRRHRSPRATPRSRWTAGSAAPSVACDRRATRGGRWSRGRCRTGASTITARTSGWSAAARRTATAPIEWPTSSSPDAAIPSRRSRSIAARTSSRSRAPSVMRSPSLPPCPRVSSSSTVWPRAANSRPELDEALQAVAHAVHDDHRGPGRRSRPGPRPQPQPVRDHVALDEARAGRARGLAEGPRHHVRERQRHEAEDDEGVERDTAEDRMPAGQGPHHLPPPCNNPRPPVNYGHRPESPRRRPGPGPDRHPARDEDPRGQPRAGAAAAQRARPGPAPEGPSQHRLRRLPGPRGRGTRGAAARVGRLRAAVRGGDPGRSARAWTR